MGLWKKFSVKYFGSIATRFLDTFRPLKEPLDKSGMKILFRSYVSMLIATSVVGFLASLSASSTVFVLFFQETIVYSLIMGVVVGLLAASGIFALFYFYPFQKARSRSQNIKANLPFAINHMSAIASSKVPPYVIFKLLSEFKEYGEISNEADKVIRNVDVFGQDITTALQEVAEDTPSGDFKEFLSGIIATIKTGGNIEDYLKVEAEQAMFDYKLKRERYLKSLSTYADFYTAVLIAAPLFLIAILAVMNMVGGEVGGRNINDLMKMGIYMGIPIMNTGFILFIHLTQPEVL